MYYTILVASQRYHKKTPLTYSYDEVLDYGTVVEIELQSQRVLGVIVGTTKKPKFNTKKVLRVIAVKALGKHGIDLMSWLGYYYPAPQGQINSLFLPSYLLNSNTKLLANKNTFLNYKKYSPPKLTVDQEEVINTITKSGSGSYLIHGDTGSGKTRVYTEIVQKVIASKKSAIILTPEIGLTPQLVENFVQCFGNKVLLLHSAMPPKERLKAWLNIASSVDPLIVIGPRSALFVPLKSVGLIVVDEMHDGAYKQEQAPYYVTSRVAGKLAKLHGAKLLLGSATPPIADYYIFKENKLPVLTLHGSAIKKDPGVSFKIVDIKDKTMFSRSYWLSNNLLDCISESLKKHEQSLIFLNRRGTARVIICRDCGWQSICPNCDLPLTYHGDTHKAVCHTCGYSEKVPTECPVCNGAEIIFRVAGTKTIVMELQKLFPEAKIQRFDSDLKKSERLQDNYRSLKSGNVDILVGTQMISKGLDLPKLSIVGVVLADTALNFPDYTAEERTYQMLNQVMGRVGRGHRPGKVIVQTHHPDSKIIKQAITNNYEAFYNDQLNERKIFRFPPYAFILKLSCSRSSQNIARNAATKLAIELNKLRLDVEIIGPSPAFIEKSSNKYTWQIVIKTTKRSNLLKIVESLPTNWSYDIDPQHLL